MFQIWLIWRYLRAGRKYLSLTSALSIIGMMLGVASLVVALAVISGYEMTLKKSVIDTTGHVMIVKKGEDLSQQVETLKELKKIVPDIEAHTPFVFLEGVIAHKKKLSGIMIQGVDLGTAMKTLNLGHRVISGEFKFDGGEKPGALVGKGLAAKFGLKVGDLFKVVLPMNTELGGETFRPKLRAFRVTGVINLGRYDYDSRYVMIDLREAQDFAELGEKISGYRIRLSEESDADGAAFLINERMGISYFTRSWKDINRNLFRAAEIERVVLFFILLIIVFAACFNVSSTLFVSVLKRYGDISILQTMGASKTFIRQLFTCQGLLIGFIGVVLGILLGFVACWGFLVIQKYWAVIPMEIYKLDHIEVDLRFIDLFATFFASMLICYLATWVPAHRGAQLSPAEGLRYE